MASAQADLHSDVIEAVAADPGARAVEALRDASIRGEDDLAEVKGIGVEMKPVIAGVAQANVVEQADILLPQRKGLPRRQACRVQYAALNPGVDELPLGHNALTAACRCHRPCSATANRSQYAFMPGRDNA
ncbi:hypothetical protein [Mesorhizobium sp. B2-3-7]|uniref:hypothetical protein n=1 Tax=unclassified Mesorhizobium TaxID=325217 RepID=UPI0032B276A1